jgi:hypothetical protein
LVVEHVWTLLHIVAFARHCRLVHLPTDSIPTRALYAVQRVRCMLCNVFLALARRSPPTCWCVICCRPRAVVSVAWCVIHVAWFPTHCGCSFRSRAVRCILRRGPFVRLSSTASRSIDSRLRREALDEYPVCADDVAHLRRRRNACAGIMPRQCSAAVSTSARACCRSVNVSVCSCVSACARVLACSACVCVRVCLRLGGWVGG